jgi:hypothetical protein
MALAVGVGVALLMFVDIQLALARIDPGNPATLPNMAPQIRYYFVPILAPAIAGAAVVVDLLLGLVYRRRFVRLTHWVLLGLAYSLVTSSLLVRYLGADGKVVLLVGPAVALACAILVRWRYGVPPQFNAV